MTKVKNNALKKEFFPGIENIIKEIELSDCIEYALLHLPAFFDKIKSDSKGALTLCLWQNAIDKEDLVFFENRRYAFEWFIKKLQHLAEIGGFVANQSIAKSIDKNLRYEFYYSSNPGYYLHELYRTFISLYKRYFSIWEVSKEYYLREYFPSEGTIDILCLVLAKRNFELLTQKVRFLNVVRPNLHLNSTGGEKPLVKSYSFHILDFSLPKRIKEEIFKPSLKALLPIWNKKMHADFLTLLRHLKFLSLGANGLPKHPQMSNLPKTFEEVDDFAKKYFIFLAFQGLRKENDISPEDLGRICRRFLVKILRELDTSTAKLKGSKLKKQVAQMAEEWCVKTLVEHVRGLTEDELNLFKKVKYSVEVTRFLQEEAKRQNLPFQEAITKTMVRERAGPVANKQLFHEYGIVWNLLKSKTA